MEKEKGRGTATNDHPGNTTDEHQFRVEGNLTASNTFPEKSAEDPWQYVSLKASITTPTHSYNPIYTFLTGSITAGTLLGAMVWRSEYKKDSNNGWFFEQENAWFLKLGINRYQLRKWKEVFKKRGWLEESYQQFNHRLFYRIHFVRLQSDIRITERALEVLHGYSIEPDRTIPDEAVSEFNRMMSEGVSPAKRSPSPFRRKPPAKRLPSPDHKRLPSPDHEKATFACSTTSYSSGTSQKTLERKGRTHSRPSAPKNGNGSTEPVRGKTKPPTLEELAAHCASIGIPDEAAKIDDYWKANGFKTGKNPVQDWQAAVRSWKLRMPEFSCDKKADGETPFQQLDRRVKEEEDRYKKAMEQASTQEEKDEIEYQHEASIKDLMEQRAMWEPKKKKSVRCY
jgi:hypothetical protein